MRANEIDLKDAEISSALIFVGFNFHAQNILFPILQSVSSLYCWYVQLLLRHEVQNIDDCLDKIY